MVDKSKTNWVITLAAILGLVAGLLDRSWIGWILAGVCVLAIIVAWMPGNEVYRRRQAVRKKEQE